MLPATRRMHFPTKETAAADCPQADPNRLGLGRAIASPFFFFLTQTRFREYSGLLGSLPQENPISRSAMSSEQPTPITNAPRRRAARATALPTLLERGTVLYSNSAPWWRGATLGERVLILTDTDAWHQVMDQLLSQVDAERLSRPGPDPAYTALELERAILFQRLAGLSTYGKARTLLAGDRHERDRQLLEFDRPRSRVGCCLYLFRSLDGVPSESTIWRYLQDVGLQRHKLIYRRLFKAIVQQHMMDPEMRDEARVLFVDGSAWRTHYRSFARRDRRTGQIKPPTLEGGGYMPRSESNPGKDGHGFMLVTGTTQTGLPLTHTMGRLGNDSELNLGHSMMNEDWTDDVAPHLDQDKLGVWVADGGFHRQALRRDLRGLGFVEVCHMVSHGELSQGHAEANDRIVIEIEGHPNWYANGHRELKCRCGSARLAKRIRLHCNGQAAVRVEGTCDNCGSITITSGLWRRAQNPDRFVKVMSGEEHETDWTLGNPLSFHDDLAAAYGSARFSQQEGFFGHMSTRFGLLEGKSWHRSRDAAERDALQVFCLMHGMAIEGRRRRRVAEQATSTGPPGEPLAA